jgi:hypothetical protein
MNALALMHMNPGMLFGFLIGFGLLVVVPVVAIISENRAKMLAHKSKETAPDVQSLARIDRLENLVVQQQKQIESLREELHTNILALDDARKLTERVQENKQV